MTPDVHNETVTRVFRDLVAAAGGSKAGVLVLVQSLLLGAALLEFPGDGRRQALVIQAIADAATDRAAELAQERHHG